ncbi:MAG TPA: hypothetical protein VH593_33675, partial [Ktedonobacteraceae bacterium]
MPWLIWKQHRSEALVGALLVVVIAIALIGQGLIFSANHGAPPLPCAPNASCQPTSQVLFLNNLEAILLSSFPWLLPLLVGVFVGVPLIAREREQHTYPLIWTQSITCNRWLAIKLGVIAGILLLAFA